VFPADCNGEFQLPISRACNGDCSVTVTVFGVGPLRRLLFTLEASEREEVSYGLDLTGFVFAPGIMRYSLLLHSSKLRDAIQANYR